MDCPFYDAGRCRSCTLLPQAYDDQVAGKQARCAELIGEDILWLPPVTSAERAFRNKAKMVVGGTMEEPTLGILDREWRGVDLRECDLHQPGLHDTFPVLAEFITSAALPPYDVAKRTGEIKHLLVTESPDGELMVRFVLRSQEAVARIRKHLPTLQDKLPIRVASVNIQPEHKAILEGPTEILLTKEESLPMRLGDVVLQLRPRSFFQTNTPVATALYAEAREWTDLVDPWWVWDLYCGVGGFARHLASPNRRIVGVEISEEAVRAANASAPEGLRFVAGDAVEFAHTEEPKPNMVVVNPPRRGIGADLATWLEESSVSHVLYSSCHAESLARDLAAMPSLRPVRGRLFDMFPHTNHYEVLTLLVRE